MFKERILTALILIPFAIGVIFFFPHPLFEIACSVLIILSAWEWTKLMGLTTIFSRSLFIILLLALLLATEIFHSPIIFAIAVLWWMLASIWIINYPKLAYMWSNKFVLTILGILVFLPCWLALVAIHRDYGSVAFLYLIILVWATDSGSYFTGISFGKHKLIPKVSPGKTIEGVLGGIGCVVIAALIFGYYFQIHNMQWIAWIGLAIITALLSIVGDLLISMLKRQCGLKDTGAVFPGHGGFLDRLDSLMAAAPTFLFGLLLLDIGLR